METLAEYYFAHDDLFVVPIEHLSPTGMSAEFAHLLRSRVDLPLGWIELFNEAFSMYWQRTRALVERAPLYWFSPRLQHGCIVTAPARVRPYFQPFNKSSWVLYASDFDPAVSNREFAAYQFVHVERMGLLQEVTQPVVRNLSYWLERSEDEIVHFCAACRQTPRPDASAFRALADAMPWIRRLAHETLKPPVLVAIEPLLRQPLTGLLLPRSLQPQLDALVRSWKLAAEGVVERFHATYARRGRDRAGDLCGWVRETQPHVLVTGPGDRILWDPDVPETIAGLRSVVGGVGEAAADSIRADLEVINTRSRRFLAALRYPNALPMADADTAQHGLSYMHLRRKLIAYNLREPGMERLRVPAPPYERFMLAARTIHEWGHLAADAGWVPVIAARRADSERLKSALADQFEEIYQAAPAAVRAHAAGEIARLTQDGRRPGEALARVALARFPDLQANLLAQHFLTVAERETYLRNNVYSLRSDYDTAALFQRLARQAYEYQYLRFSSIADPRHYFLGSTWVPDDYVARGVLSETQLDHLLATLGELCDCYTVDRAQFVPELFVPPAASADLGEV